MMLILMKLLQLVRLFRLQFVSAVGEILQLKEAFDAHSPSVHQRCSRCRTRCGESSRGRERLPACERLARERRLTVAERQAIDP